MKPSCINSVRAPRFAALLAAALLVTAPAPARGQALPRASVHMPEGVGTVEIPFETYRRWMVVPVRVAGSQPMTFILDTGAPITVLASKEVGTTLPLQIIGQAMIGGAGDGAAKTVPVAGDVHLQIGNLVITGAPMAVGLGAEAIAGADGIVGGPIFENLVVEIDFIEQMLILHEPGQYEYRGSGTVLPLHTMPSGHLLTTARVSVGGEAPVPVGLVVDSGAGHALSLEIDEVPGLGTPAHRLEDVVIGWGSNGVARGDIGRVATVQLGDLTLERVVASFPHGSPWSAIGDAQSVTLQGNLGAQVLQRFRVIFDVPHARLILEPNELFGRPFEFDNAGMALAPSAPGTEAVSVADVVAGSPADEAGIRVGDDIIAIDDQPVSGLPTDRVRQLLEGAPGDIVRLRVRRGDAEFERALTLRALI